MVQMVHDCWNKIINLFCTPRSLKDRARFVCDGGQVDSALTFNFDNPSSNPN